MKLTFFRAKLHRVRVTQAELHYEGSITIDSDLLDVSGIYPYEKVHVVNVNNGARLETYVIAAPRGSRTICMNGPAARLAAVGDHVIIMAYAEVDAAEARDHAARVVFVDEDNAPVSIREYSVADAIEEGVSL